MGATITSSRARSSIAGSSAEDFLEFATYSGNRYGTLRSEVRRRLDAGRLGRAGDRGAGGAPGSRRDARVDPGLHRAHPTPPCCATPARSRGTDSADGDRRPARGRGAGTGRPGRVRVPGCQRRSRPRRRRAGGDRARRARLTSRLRGRMIKPRVQTNCSSTPTRTTPPSWSRRSGRARSTATSTTSARADSASTRRRWSRSRAASNYLSMALEELAEGKLRYEYRA